MLWVLLVVLVLNFLMVMSTYGALERVRRGQDQLKKDVWAINLRLPGVGSQESDPDAPVQDLERWRARQDRNRRKAELDKAAAEEGNVVHMCPPPGLGLTLCCGKNPLELPSHDQMTLNAALVTCSDPEAG